METDLIKEERVELRISSKDKEFFKRAQLISGDKTFSSFILRILKKEAEAILAKNQTVLASERDRQLFIDAVFGLSEPGSNLVEAAKRYKKKKSDR